VGQLGFLPVQLWVDGERVSAWRTFALVLAREWRQWIMRIDKHPFLKMWIYGSEEVQARQGQLVFGTPGFKFLPILQKVISRRFRASMTGSFPLWSVPLPLPRTLTRNHEFETVALEDISSAEVDELCQSLWNRPGCSGVKNANVLHWKMLTEGYSAIAVKDRGRLIGVATMRQKRAGKHNRQQLDICDLLAPDASATEATLRAAVGQAQNMAGLCEAGDPLVKVTMLITEPLQRPAAELGFIRDDYDFGLYVHMLSETISPSRVAPERWHLSADD
jgi:hypothetical protein